jgi:hypothetical protein
MCGYAAAYVHSFCMLSCVERLVDSSHIFTHMVACGGVHYKKPKHSVILYNEAFFVNKMLRWTELWLFLIRFCNFANVFSHFGIFRRDPTARFFNFMYPSFTPQAEMKTGLCKLFPSFTP